MKASSLVIVLLVFFVHAVVASLHPSSHENLNPTDRQNVVLRTKMQVITAVNKKKLNASARLKIINVAIQLISQYNPNFFVYKAFRRRDPVGELNALRRKINRMSTYQFHIAVKKIFIALKDGHTTYVPPQPMRSAAAILGFNVIDTFKSAKSPPVYMVTRTINGISLGKANISVGTVILKYDGLPIARAVKKLSSFAQSWDADTRVASALPLLTLRTLCCDPNPTKSHVTIQYRTVRGKVESATLPWRYAVLASTVGNAGVTGSMAAGLNEPVGLSMREAMLAKIPFLDTKSPIWRSTTSSPEGFPTVIGRQANNIVPFVLRNHFEAHNLLVDGTVVGYLNVKDFATPLSPIAEAALTNMVKKLPKKRLILDIRANPGGFLRNAKLLFEVLSDKSIDAIPFMVRASNLTKTLVTTNLNTLIPEARGFVLQRGLPVLTAHLLGERFSGPIQGIFSRLGKSPKRVMKQAFFGKFITLTDGKCASACELFAALIRDTQASELIGLEPSTNGVVTTVLPYSTLRAVFPRAFPTTLPDGIDFRTSSDRYFRTGLRSGMALEAIGVEVDARYFMTKEDRLGTGNLARVLTKRLLA